MRTKIIGILVVALLLTTALPVLGVINDKRIPEDPFHEPSWQWAKGGGGLSIDYGYDVDVDGSGNSYVVGKFDTAALLGTTTLTGHGGWDIFVAKLDADGVWHWAAAAGGIFQDEGLGIAVDDEGNSYITGVFYDVAWFGNISLTSLGGLDVFVAKLDTNGNWQWAIRAGGYVGEAGYGIAVDSNGGLYVTGHFMFRATFGTTILTSQGGADVFVAKLDTNGNWQWAVSGGGSLADYVHDIASDRDGNTCITGDFEGSASFGTTTLTSQGDPDVFVAKLDTNGNWQWAQSAGGSSIERGYDVAIDINGDTCITGTFMMSASFGTTTLISQGDFDIFVAKLDTNGDWRWATSAGGSTSDCGWSIAVDGDGNNYIAGVFEGSVSFGTTTLVSQGIKDIYVAKLDTDGAWQWAISAGGVDWDEGYALAVDSNRYIYITGYFDGTATFGETTITTQGDFDVFIARLSYDATVEIDFNITSGLGVNAVITNSGIENASDVPWLIHVEGGILGLIKKTAEGTVDIPAGGSTTVWTGILFGLGPIAITARVGAEEKTATGTQFIIFSMVK